jgi:ABC-type transport system involved in multi-copper enzyme maturation permease subunit
VTVRRRMLMDGVSAIWLREIRGRMRGRRAFVFLTIYLSVLGAFVWLGLRAVSNFPLGALESVTVGRGIFAAIVLIETLAVLILAPAYTAPSISQEREKQTYDLLAVTPVSSLAIVVGKLLSSMSFLAIIVGASIPLASLAFLFGGIDVIDLVVAYVVIFTVAIGGSAIGVACSAMFRRTQAATVASFIVVALAAAGTTVAWMTLASQTPDGREPPPEALLYPNPFVAQADVLCAATGGGCLFNDLRRQQVVVAPAPAMFGADGQPMPGALPGVAVQDVQVPAAPGSRWPLTVAEWLALAVVAVLVASRSISPTRTRPTHSSALAGQERVTP